MFFEPLNIEQLRPHLGELNYILKDYGVSIEISVDKESGNVAMKNGKALIKIGPPHEWTE